MAPRKKPPLIIALTPIGAEPQPLHAFPRDILLGLDAALPVE
jgi:hypothetical protein